MCVVSFMYVDLHGETFEHNMATKCNFVSRDHGNITEIDQGIKNKWNWSWCERKLLPNTPDEHLIYDCFWENPPKNLKC